MERLTNSIDYCQMHCDFGKKVECFFQDKSKCYENNMYNQLRQYEIAEKQGLIIRLPCPIGTKVYYAQKCQAPSCKGCLGFTRVHNCYCEYKSRIFEQEFDYRHLYAFGKTVFLTKEEAEQALAERENNE